MRFSKTQLGLFLALLAGNAIVLYSNLQWGWLRIPAAVVLMFVLPGWAWLPALGWMQTRRGLERIMLVGGLSSLFSATALLVALLLPGPFTETPVLVALNLVILAGLVFQALQRANRKLQIANGELQIANGKSQIESGKSQAANSKFSIGNLEWPSRRVLLILLVILAVATVTRLTRIGYAEFHEDELENMRLIVRAFKGEEYAPFLDSKGPIHWLLPAGLWYLNGWVNEGIARTPVLITSLLLIPTMYALGRRMGKGRDSVGLLAAGLVALNGFYVAYARHVENQSLIVFWGALAMWFAYRYYREDRPHFLIWVALALGIGLIAHPDMLLYLPVFGYIIWMKLWPDRRLARQQWSWLLVAGLLFGGLIGLFYVPYLTDPNIGLVFQYFGAERVGTSLFYNRVANLFDQDKLYSTRFHAPVLALLLFWLLARHFIRWRRRGGLILAGLGLAMASTVIWPEVWVVAGVNLAFMPYALLTMGVLFLPKTSFEIKALFLWMVVPLGALVFLAKDAADHVQVAYTGWSLLAAFALVDLWECLSIERRTQPAIRGNKSMFNLLKLLIAISLGIITGLILFYQYLAFDSTVTAYWQAKIDVESNSNSLYNWVYGGIPRPRKIFSNPRLGGWKVVGYLWETGVLGDDFRSINESFAVPIWYTFQTPRSCYTDPQNYWLRRDWRDWPEEESEVVTQGYALTRVVLVDHQPKLHLYEKQASGEEPELLDLEDYRHRFDLLATPARFAQAEPMSQVTSLNFGDKLLLRGYDLPRQTARPGDLLPVTVYWEGLAPMETRYRGFIHLLGTDDSRWGQHDDDPACRLLTTDMRPGQRSSRQFRLPVDPATPPGEYQVAFGLYDPTTFERLEIWDNLSQQSAGTSLILGEITVQ